VLHGSGQKTNSKRNRAAPLKSERAGNPKQKEPDVTHNPNQPLIFNAVIRSGQETVPFEQVDPMAASEPAQPVEAKPEKLSWWGRLKAKFANFKSWAASFFV
jgi:hypothetical protein